MWWFYHIYVCTPSARIAAPPTCGRGSYVWLRHSMIVPSNYSIIHYSIRHTVTIPSMYSIIHSWWFHLCTLSYVHSWWLHLIYSISHTVTVPSQPSPFRLTDFSQAVFQSGTYLPLTLHCRDSMWVPHLSTCRGGGHVWTNHMSMYSGTCLRIVVTV